MIRIINLIDDPQLGGVTRGVADLARCLGDDFTVEIVQVDTMKWSSEPLDADILVINFTMSWAKLPYLMALRRSFAGKVVIVEHSYTEAFERECVPVRWRFRMMLRLAYLLCDKVVAVSDGQARWLREAGLVAARRLTSIPQSLDLSELGDLPPPLPRGFPLRLGAYGRFVEQKGFDVLLDAMRMVPPNIATLTIAGYGPNEAAMRATAADLPHVHIGGRTNGPAAFLCDVDVVVVPSRWEAYGLVAQEARAAGRPLIASAVDGLVEQVDDSWGLLVTPNDPRVLAAAIISMAMTDRQSMSVVARVSAVNSFERKIAAWRDLYGQVRQPRIALVE